jgi:hypothetical protein
VQNSSSSSSNRDFDSFEDHAELDADNVDVSTLNQVREQYPDIANVRIALKQLYPSLRPSGDYASVSKKLANLLHALKHKKATALKSITTHSASGMPEPIMFYQRTFNTVDRIDRFVTLIEWAAKFSSEQMVILVYLLRLAITNIHAVLGELQIMQSAPGNAIATSDPSESDDPGVELARIKDTLAKLNKTMSDYEQQMLGHPKFVAPATPTKRSHASRATTSSTNDS